MMSWTAPVDGKLPFVQGRSNRGGHGGRVPRAPYHVPLNQNDNSLSSELTFDEWRGVIIITAVINDMQQ